MFFLQAHMVDVVVYMPPTANSPALTINAATDLPATFRVDRIVVKKYGRNVGGCMLDRLVNADQLPEGEAPTVFPAFTVDSSEELGSSCSLQLGAVTNVGTYWIWSPMSVHVPTIRR